ncbi:MAG: DNA helicase RecQ [Gammaproteobacteria bacterium]|nr:DNA helicase RecQ [Gammaproteobacteria bacterium]
MSSATGAAALQILQQQFGYPAFRDRQEEVITTLVAGNDALVLMPTGGGKSLCYQIPALIRPGVGVVISPLIALMQDQVTALRQNGIAAAYLNSTLSSDEVYEIEHALRQGAVDLLYIAPERLMLPRTLDLLASIDLALFAIDEAHCVSQWGHDFRPEYIQLSTLHQRFPRIPRVALTATADTPTRREIIQRLALEEAQHFISSFDRPNIRYQITENMGNAREKLLRFIRDEHPGEAGIVYCLSRRKVDETAVWLNHQGVTALPYHAGLNSEVRGHHQHRFLREDGVVMVATIAFGMGIDKPDVRFVAHLSLPKSIESYYQETGRAGRDGLPADAWMCYGLQDVITLRQMQAQSGADEQHKRIEHHKLDAMLGLCETIRCRRQLLLHYFDDPLEEPCGNCDTCLDPPQSWDATIAAQKALSCVYRTGQRFGVNYLIDVLLGSSNQRLLNFGHHQLSTYGIGRELTQQAWRNLFRQLIAHGLLEVDVEGHGALRLTELSRPLLRGEQKLTLRQVRSEKQRKQRVERGAKRQLKEEQMVLWESLRRLRKEFADEQGIPAFTIFHDSTLVEMVERHPTTMEQLAHISGVGEKKLAAYGQRFVELLQEDDSPTTEPDLRQSGSLPQQTLQRGESNRQRGLELLQQGIAIEDIAGQLGLKPSTIYSYCAEAIAEGKVDLYAVTGLEAEELKTILDTYALLEERGRLKPLYEALDKRYPYDILRCVVAAAGE